MTERCFVDTNGLLYLRDRRDPASQRAAAEWCAHPWAEEAGRLSVPVLTEY